MKFIEHIYNTFVVCEKSRIVPLTSGIVKIFFEFPTCSAFPLKLICCIAFRSALSTSCLLRSIVASF